jgi:hypothetical protein
MAALTADRPIEKANITARLAFPVKASTTIYGGGIVAIDKTTGYAVAANEAASRQVVGVAEAKVDNSAGANGDKWVSVLQGEFDMDATSIAQTGVGSQMYLADDHTVDETAGANSVKAGMLVKYTSATRGRVQIVPGWI